MPASKYTSFHIKNTASVPMEVSLTDPDGNSQKVGPLNPGQESMQVAPIGTTWSIKFVSSDEISGALNATRDSSAATKDSSDATKDSSDATKDSSDATKDSSDATKDSSDATKDSDDATN
jgi:hypothetical protein